MNCTHHPQRVAAGICTGCRSPVCNECITKIQGINTCKPCLERRAEAAAAPRRAASGIRDAAWFGASLLLLSGVFLLYALLFSTIL